jgi:transcriptional regulator with XRE-family HTH domain
MMAKGKYKLFAQRLRDARINAGFKSAAGFALSIGVDPAAYRMYERGNFPPRMGNFMRICEALSVEPNDLLLEKKNGNGA